MKRMFFPGVSRRERRVTSTVPARRTRAPRFLHTRRFLRTPRFCTPHFLRVPSFRARIITILPGVLLATLLAALLALTLSASGCSSKRSHGDDIHSANAGHEKAPDGESASGTDYGNTSETDTETDPLVRAFALTVNGQILLVSEDEESALGYIETLTEREKERLEQSGKYDEVVSVHLLAEVSAEEIYCKKSEINSPQNAITPETPLSFAALARTKETFYTEPETVYKNSSAHYEGTSVTESEGVTGVGTLTCEIALTDGVEVSRRTVKTETVIEKKDKVVLVGTKKNTASTGSYAFPLGYMYVTSPYGYRVLNGTREFHLGVDLRAAVGTAVYAADGGEVIFAGQSGSYGYLIKIKHDNGDLTYYAHLSKLEVGVGTRVYKGQKIAFSGATGNVTGPHLHFEIRKNGKTVDPLTCLPSF